MKYSMSMLVCASLLAGLGLTPGALARSSAAAQKPSEAQEPAKVKPAQGEPQHTGPGATGPQPSQATPPAPRQDAPRQEAGQSGVVAPVQLPKEPPPVASDYQSPGRALPPAERVGVDVADQVSITLDEAIALALANNKEISASRIDVDIARFDVDSSRGVYDPRLEGDVDYRKTTSPSA
ncbi:MAG TPA: TolC family protein, partial [Blastocatellia bacterium]|nr:TolC family protein [Blastocatellia bacterium]